ncbi:MAG: 4-hydroxybenzoate octaprenyltransferase [Casimicrobiaceae bacterium]|nr:4-hydroxybenzoate octaprenyltransferase [Casimicrobiaceae bacterium]MDW8312257.1 4-hydroxybenzoate octaprenyltransferase [Burkholderiales bacterium]
MNRLLNHPWARRLDAYERLMRLDKPVGFMLLMWPTLWGLWFASLGAPDWRVVGIFVLGTILMRSAGCAVNDWADRNFDGAVKRTAARPLPAGEIAPWEALAVAAFCALAAAVLLIPLPWEARLWALPALAIAVVYPFTKRFFAVPQAVLGVAFSMGIPMAYAAVLGRVPQIAWWLMLANFFWVMAYDTQYAMVDRDDDVRIGIRTSAIFFGRFDVAAVALSYLLFLGLMAWIGWRAGMGGFYFAGLALAAVLAVAYVWQIRAREREACFAAFRGNNLLGLCVFAGVALDFAVRLRAWPRWYG